MVSLRDLLRLASRTFAIGIEQLPAVLCDAGTVAYLLLRVSDYLEDNEEMPSEKKIELLNLWAEVLNGSVNVHELTNRIQVADTSNPDAVVAQHAEDILARLALLPKEVREIITPHVIHSTQGMARWVARGPQVNDEADMDDYMFEVAGRVGYLLTHLFAWYSLFIRFRIKELLPLAREFGLALQTVNVIRGLRKDYERGWVYIPKKFLEAVNLSAHELFLPENRAEAIKVLDMLADKAERHLHAALTCVKTLPRWQHRIRLACIFPLMFAIRTLAISRRNTDVFNSEAKMTREEVKRIVRDATLWGWSNRWLDSYSRELNVVVKE
ncbi:MAG TPA: squalene/phytoene synthase family protein [Anaerolineales bacterium]|jgi:farnesyl-diphosphate farnesyltransferase|nr:squalene/phytoene synthase family protein [Anaerolineales bacterium]HQX17719.1 squalene/phytoene synthase family protein [Anaerolineales bacterium]